MKMTHNELGHKVIGSNRTRASIKVKEPNYSKHIITQTMGSDPKMTHNELGHKVIGSNRTRASIKVKESTPRRRRKKQKSKKQIRNLGAAKTRTN